MVKKLRHEITIIPQEEFILKIVEINKSRCYYDIGANPGLDIWLTKNLLRKENIDIIAFEPSKEGYLEYKKLFGQYKKIKLFNIGLGNKAEVRNLKIIPSRYWWATLSKRRRFTKNDDITTNQRVRIESLDSFYKKKELPSPDIIKIDTQGWEYKVVLGAKKLIKKSTRFIYRTSLRICKDFQDMQILLRKLSYNYLKIFHINASYNRVFPYCIFYHLKEKEKIIKIFNELSEADFRKFYFETSALLASKNFN